jgi:hypothetical protein
MKDIAEGALVEPHQPVGLEALRQNDQRRIGETELQVAIASRHMERGTELGSCQALDLERALSKVLKER